MSNKKGLFNWETLTVQFGGEYSKPEHIFTATALRIPTFTRQKKERESLGGGWYGAKEMVTITYDKVFVIVKDETCIGVMHEPYEQCHGIKTPLMPIDTKTPHEVIKFLKDRNIQY